MTSVQEVGREIAEHATEVADEVVARWSQIAQNEPWLDRFTQIRQDHLPGLIRALARSALIDPENGAATRQLLHAARRHGASRREDGHEDSVLPAEYVLLRRALRHVLIRERETAPGLLLPTLARLELGIGMAEAASLHGYHEEEVDIATGDDHLLEEWSGLFHVVLDED